MFGLLRFFLALIVCFNHMPRQTFPFGLSIVAVVIFYMLSGYTMGLKFKHLKDKLKNPIVVFVLDRALRVYPLYIAVSLLYYFAVVKLGSSELITFTPSLKNLVANFTLITTNLYYFTQIDLLIPPSYSLALEEQFYILMPFLMYYEKYVPFIILGFLSSLICSALVFSGQDAQLFGNVLIYRTLLPTLPIFFLGISMGKNVLKDNIFKLIYGFFLFNFLISFIFGLNNSGYFFHINLGVLIGAPVIYWLKDLKRNAFDDKIGLLAYPIFLCHFLVYFILEHKNAMTFINDLFGSEPITQVNLNIAVYRSFATLLTVLLAYLLVLFVEIPIHKLRANFSKRIGILKNA